MLHVTPRARSELCQMLGQVLADRAPGIAADLGFRIVVAGEGTSSQLGLALDTARAGDEVLEHDGRSVLIVDALTSDLLGHLTLDVVETPDGTRLEIRE